MKKFLIIGTAALALSSGLAAHAGYVGNDPINFTDPTGQRRDNPGIDRRADDASKAARRFAGALVPFKENYEDMRDANTMGADKFFHCVANCEGARSSEDGPLYSRGISEVREIIDQATGDSAEQSEADRDANRMGRKGGQDNPDQSCSDVCSELIPNGLDPQYTDGIEPPDPDVELPLPEEEQR